MTVSLAEALRERRVADVRCPVAKFLNSLDEKTRADYAHTLDHLTGRDPDKEFTAAEIARYFVEHHRVDLPAQKVQAHVARRCRCPSPTT